METSHAIIGLYTGRYQVLLSAYGHHSSLDFPPRVYPS